MACYASSVRLQTKVVAYTPELILIRPHLALGQSRLLSYSLLIRRASGKFPLHILESILNALMGLLKRAGPLLDSVPLLLVQPLHQLLAILLHGAEVLLEPLLLLTGLICIETLPLGVPRHVTGSRAGLLHGLIAGPVLVSLLRCGLIAELLTLPGLCLVLRLAPRLTVSLARPSLASLLSAASLRLALSLTAATATTLCPYERWRERKGNG